jgi:hypothetical protein
MIHNARRSSAQSLVLPVTLKKRQAQHAENHDEEPPQPEKRSMN